MGLCELDTIRDVLGRHGFHFSKSLGQNFLTAAWVPERIAEECGVSEREGVLEVGPGLGCLTQELSKRAGKVVAIELDQRLLPVMAETLTGFENIEVIQGDILKTDIAALCKEKFGGMRIHACANLPYYITTPAIAALLDSGILESITVMVQKEVAERICAAAGTAEYSAFSIYVQYHAEARLLFEVPRECFVPQPKVDSAVLRLVPLSEPAVNACDEKLYFSIVRAAFNQRRKTLANALSAAFSGRLEKPEILEIIRGCGLDERIRGERLSLLDFAALTNAAAGILAAGQYSQTQESL